jgi:hypothetical protein
MKNSDSPVDVFEHVAVRAIADGELAPEDPVEGSKASDGRLDRGNHAEHVEVLNHVHRTRTNTHGAPSGMVNLSSEEPNALI